MIRIDKHAKKYPSSPLGPQTAWSHLWSDTNDVDELHKFAKKLKLKRSWFQDRKNFPHYDVAGTRLHSVAITLGAVPSSLRDWWVKTNLPTETK